ncbi:hypothetical protein DFJ77DRAFT_479371 [Powellomyces hirtus]|nr:hypothetical protein DFJ77DRAFT_479371 [Powellomyces hirtus]
MPSATSTSPSSSSPSSSATTFSAHPQQQQPYVARPSGSEERQRILQRLQRDAAASATRARKPPSASSSLTCDICSTSFDVSKQTHHLQSKQHRQNVAGKPDSKQSKKKTNEAAAAAAVSEKSSWEDETDCLFCLRSSDNLQANISHMKSAHSFLIPDIEYVAAPVELMIYLNAIIESGACLHCHSPEARAMKKAVTAVSDDDHDSDEDDDENQYFRFSTRGPFQSSRDARRHMIAKGHCKVSWDTGAQIAIDGIYDYGVSSVDVESVENAEHSSQPPEHPAHTASPQHLAPAVRPVPPRPRNSATAAPRSMLESSRHQRSRLPASLVIALASLPPRTRNRLQRCRRAELVSLAGLSPGELGRIASNLDAATRIDTGMRTRAYAEAGVRFNAQRRVGGPSTKPKGAMGFGLYYLNT